MLSKDQNGLAEFAASFADPGRHDVGSIRIDDAITQKLNLFVRYNAGTSRQIRAVPACFR